MKRGILGLLISGLFSLSYADKCIYYTVKKGDSYWEIAKKFRLDTKTLMKANRDKKVLRRGDRICIPSKTFAERKSARSKGPYAYYTVKRGGRLSDVAKATGVPLSELERLNPRLKGKFLKAGTKVKVPVSKAKVEKTKTTYKVHTVKKGETLISIAKSYGVSIGEIKRANNLRSSRLLVGQRIRIPVEVGSQRVHKREEIKLALRRTQRIIPRTEDHRTFQVSLSKHSLPMPVEGKVVQSPKGVDIITDCGNSVKSVANGRVLYSGGDLQAYGNMVIIEHDGFMSLYAFNEENLVKRGDRVLKGQTIAKVGKKAGEEQCMLRFELRDKDGAPLNPVDYLLVDTE